MNQDLGTPCYFLNEKHIIKVDFHLLEIGGSKGGIRDAPPGPIPFVFMQFSGKKLLNSRLAPSLWGLHAQ